MATSALTTSSHYSTGTGPVVLFPDPKGAYVETVTSRKGPYANGFVYDTTTDGYFDNMPMPGTVTFGYDATNAARGIYFTQIALTTNGTSGTDDIFTPGPFTYMITWNGTTTTGSSGIPTVTEFAIEGWWSHSTGRPVTYGFTDINIVTTGVLDSSFQTATITILSSAPIKLPAVGLLLLAFVSFILVL